MKMTVAISVLAATLATTAFAQTNNSKGDADREKNVAPVATPRTPTATQVAPRAATGTGTASDPAAIGTDGRDKQTGAPKDKD